MSTPLLSQLSNLHRRFTNFLSLTSLSLIHLARFCSSSDTPTWNSNSKLCVSHPVLSLMESCTTMNQLVQIQAHMTRKGLMTHRFPVSRVLAFCSLSENGNMQHARLVFEQILDRNVFIYNTMIRGYTRTSSPVEALILFHQILGHGLAVENRTMVFVLKACEQFNELDEGEQIHGLILKMGFGFDILVHNALIHFYAEHGDLVVARQVFDEMGDRDVVSWTSMIDAYSQYKNPDEALKLFYEMVLGNYESNEVTMITAVSACSQIGILELGRSIHFYAMKIGTKFTVNLLNSLVDMYTKCGGVEFARELFDGMAVKDVFSWTSMINGYAKCGMLELAHELFDEMPARNEVTWNALISGYSQTYRPREALNLFHAMCMENVVPIEGSLVAALSACAQLGDLDLGSWIHRHYVEEKRVQLSVILTNALIDMYAKCGCIENASKLFEEMAERDVVSWNSVIMACAMHGDGIRALGLFDRMVATRVKPDDITFVGVLSACSHSGMITEGRRHFDSMKRVHGIKPKTEHYACILDLLGRVGLLEEALSLMRSMPMVPDVACWGALLSASRMHGNVELGELAVENLIRLDPSDSGIYVLLANIYASKGKWDDVKRVRRMMRENGVKKAPGSSFVELEGKFHEFLVEDKSHPQSKEIYLILDEISEQLKLEGYVPRLQKLACV
ncbi:pentatricopeptide repeat-containing protein At2g22410, mitochondrial-like [Amborella trichopoda]|uniref:pentatricopeptide repeat-containing protein At2g22410, mitochondrial-like n=1 Tax=Amborella trichopoda TaxID=13333 RepID=UPI0009BF8BF9|nr:pentatricopeptide repeat-containing protein At2g22410, mitochondrial-like [Amborella trichopoda]|eukprot:XP_011625801.2 pentatricopeptide repeat-containing protein At2g22410, mitochondrial-like [Amborella trichopoda]